MGRTATHEVAHWLNLKHIWGHNSNCTDDDEVVDTPRQKGSNSGCPTFPCIVQNCPDTGMNGTMFMNYLDYTDDQCMCMFTAGQALRMRATLYTLRNSILMSDGLIPPYNTAADLFSQDTPYDVGDEPNLVSDCFWISEDIWIRNTNDGTTNQEHQNPIYGQPNYVYIRIRNRSCSQAGNGNVKMYWAKDSTSLGWPAPWDGSVSSPASMGGPIGTMNTGNVPARSVTILEFPWNPPNPSDYSSLGADKTHFCLLSRIETSSTPPYGLITEGPDLVMNVKNNNNIAWKNISILGPISARGRAMAYNYSKEQITSKFVFFVPDKEPSVFDFSRVILRLDNSSLIKWEEGGKKKVGLNPDPRIKGEFHVAQDGATIENIKLEPSEIFLMDFEFRMTAENKNMNHLFNFDILQFVKGKVIGGQRLVIKTSPIKLSKE